MLYVTCTAVCTVCHCTQHKTFCFFLVIPAAELQPLSWAACHIRNACLYPKYMGDQPECIMTGKSNVRTRSSAKQYRQSARRRKCSKRRPTSVISPSCESSGKSRQVLTDNKHAEPLQLALLSVGPWHSSVVHWVTALQAFICSTDLQGVPDVDALTCVSCCGCTCAMHNICIASYLVALPAAMMLRSVQTIPQHFPK